MPRRRFIAPLRADVPASRFLHPVFSPLERHRSLFSGSDWPMLDDLNAALPQAPVPTHAVSVPSPRFVAQTDALLADGLHYETRIRERGEIATRANSWHDLFNALAWLRYPQLKQALNQRQAEDVARFGTRQRSRGQEAMTQFDEAGCVVLLRDPGLLALWDVHDWPGLFWHERDAWTDGRIGLAVFGHALHEHALHPELLLVGKCLVVCDGRATGSRDSDAMGVGCNARDDDMSSALAIIADAIVTDRVLLDPAELRPLPLSGIPGWHPRTDDPAFYREAACFRSRREGRRYPAPLPSR